MGNETITIQNGDKLRKWVAMIVPIIVLIITGAIAWANLGNEINKVNASLSQYKITDCERMHSQDVVIAELKKDGTRLSHSNEKRIISIESDVKYTKETVTRIEKIVEKLANK